MKENSFIIIFKDKDKVKNQLVLAISYLDANKAFKLKYPGVDIELLSLMSYADIEEKLDDLKNVYDDAKLINNEKGELIEVRPHHHQYTEIEDYLTKEQLKYSFVGMLELFKSPSSDFLISENIEVDWK